MDAAAAAANSFPVFRRGKWVPVSLPFSDPGLTEGQLRFAAAAAVGGRGEVTAASIAAAEAALYERVYHGLRVSGKEHGTPKH